MESNPYHTMNEQYGIAGHVTFQAGPGGLATAVIENTHASAAVTLAGGHVLSYQPKGQEPVLWLSPKSAFAVGMAIRGGVPLCWPWFGPHPDDRGKPQHGFVRTMQWSVTGTRALDDGSTELRLAVCDTPETRALWFYRFLLEAVVTVGPSLRVAMQVRNTGNEPFNYTAALHPYFQVSDIRRISISGLEGVSYLDKTRDMQRNPGEESLRITGWTDRVYTGTKSDLLIRDEGYGRTIRVRKSGSRTSVVWNPDEKAAQMADLGAGNQRSFVCVEPANGIDDSVTVPPGGEAQLGMEVTVEGQGQP